MASPSASQNYAFSPPFANSVLPSVKRRPSESSAAPSKRRKTSTASLVHPLRQTSYLGDDAYGVRSPSLDNMSMVSSVIAPPGGPKKRGPRGPYKKDTNFANADNESAVGGRAHTATSEISDRRRAAKGRKTDEDDAAEDEDDGAEDSMTVSIQVRTNEEQEKEKQHRAMLVSAFDDDQFRRYEVWRSSRLADSVVKRTLSQSAPPAPVLAVKSVAKVWAGELIERARKVQTLWLEVADEEHSDQASAYMPPNMTDEEKQQRLVMNKVKRGPLTPDHLREAIRLMKLEQPGGVGFRNMGRQPFAAGVERFGSRVGYKRLFR